VYLGTVLCICGKMNIGRIRPVRRHVELCMGTKARARASIQGIIIKGRGCIIVSASWLKLRVRWSMM